MEYYTILNFKKEPFSNSPEPDFFFEAPKYVSCLQKLELAVRLRRGLNVVIGDIGTGKTTLCRKLIQQLSLPTKDSQKIEIHLLLDPSFDGKTGFLQAICTLIGIQDLDGPENEWQLKEKIKNHLFRKGIDENKIIVLIIDEGQKIPENCIEIMREFLNYETNNFKLLQIVIFAQPEFNKILKKYANLSDRINYLYYLTNMNFKEMRDMIKFRINVARNFEKGSEPITFWGMLAIYLATRGYPRRVVLLCHRVLLMLIVRGRESAGYFLVRDCINEMFSPVFYRIRWRQKEFPRLFLRAYLMCRNSIPSMTFIRKCLFLKIQRILKKTFAMTVSPVAFWTDYPVRSDVFKNKIQDVKMLNSLGILTMNKGRALFPAIPAAIKPTKDVNFTVMLEKGNNMKTMCNLFLKKNI